MIFHIHANQSNVGDWLSAKGIQEMIAPVRVQELFCDEPFVPETIAALHNAGPDDFVIIGGGGLFMDYFAPFWEGFASVASRVPFCLWGVGCCDHKLEHTRLSRKLLNEIVRRSQLCIVRDKLTSLMLPECDLPEPVPCPSIVAVASRSEHQKRVLHVDHYDLVGARIYERMLAIAQQYAERTGRKYRQTNNRILKGKIAALNETLDLYASAELVLSSRLHGCIIALATGRRVLAVSGDHKIDSFMSAAGLNDWVCGLNEIDSVPERLEALPAQKIPIRFIEDARNRNRAVAQQLRPLLERSQKHDAFPCEPSLQE